MWLRIIDTIIKTKSKIKEFVMKILKKIEEVMKADKIKSEEMRRRLGRKNFLNKIEIQMFS